MKNHAGFVVCVVLTLTLSVGANVAVLSIVNALWWKPSHVSPDAVMILGSTGSATGSTETVLFAEHGLNRYLRSSASFEIVAGQVATSGENVGYRVDLKLLPNAAQLQTTAVTWQYFKTIGVNVSSGRDFDEADDREGAEPVAIVSNRLWRQVLGGRSDLLGTVVDASPFPIRIIGVAPAGFQGARIGERVDAWIPRALVRLATPNRTRGAPPLLPFAKLKKGIPADLAERTIRNVMPTASLAVVPVREAAGSADQPTLRLPGQSLLFIVSATAALLLAAGWATLMALMIVHYERRRSEFAIRIALGASTADLARQLFREISVLAFAGGTGAVLAALLVVELAGRLTLPGGLLIGDLNVRLDWRVVLTALLVAHATVSFASVVPLVRLARSAATAGLGLTSLGSRQSVSVRTAVLSVHVATTVLILIAAGLFVRSIAFGIQGGASSYEDKLFVDIQVRPVLRAADETDRDLALAARLEELLTRLRAIAGVRSVSLGRAPIGPNQTAQVAQGREVSILGESRRSRFAISEVGPEYLETIGAKLIAGRSLQAVDLGSSSPTPAVVTASLADAFWPGTSPVGQRFSRIGQEPYEVIGVVSDIVQGSLFSGGTPLAIFVATNPQTLIRYPSVGLVIAGPPARVSHPVRSAIGELFPDGATIEFLTGREIVLRELGRLLTGAWFFGGFGLVGLALGLGSVYGLVSYIAETRRREMALRIALGATGRQVMLDTMTAIVAPVMSGIGVGLFIAALSASVLRSFLIGVQPYDSATFCVVASVVLTGAIGAGWFAARRLHTINPNETLKQA